MMRDFLIWLRGGQAALAEDRQRRWIAELEASGALVYVCPRGGVAWSRQLDATLESLQRMHRTNAGCYV